MKEGWGFSSFSLTDFPTSRHSIWAQPPLTEGWSVYKVPGDLDDPLNDLLDEAGVPN